MVGLATRSFGSLGFALSRKSVRFALGSGGSLAAVVTIALIAGDRHPATAWTAALDRGTFDLRQRLLARPAPDRLIIVSADGVADGDSSAERGAQRALLARFIERARAAGASVIVLDMLLLEGSDDPTVDENFARVMAARPDIVLAADVRSSGTRDNRSTVLPMQEPLFPAPIFAESAAGVGVAADLFDPDSVVRRARVQSHLLGVPYWSLAVEVLRVSLGLDLEEVRFEDGVVTLGDHSIETGLEYFIDYRRARPSLSMTNIMRGTAVPVRAQPLFENAIVLVGRNDAGQQVVATPLSSSVPRIFAHASELATLMEGQVRHDAPAFLEILFIWILALGGASIFFLRPSGTGFLIWSSGWAILVTLFMVPFATGTVLSVAGPTLVWGLIFPMAFVYRLHISREDVMARDRSIAAIARMRDVRFEGPKLGETLTPLLRTLGAALDAQSVVLFQEGKEFWEMVGGIGPPPQDWDAIRRAVAQTNGEPVLEPGGREAYVPIIVDGDDRRRVLYVRGTRNLRPLDTHTLLSVASGLHLGFQNRALTRSLEQAYLGILTTISAAVEARDPGTEEHCQRLAAYSCAMGRELGYAEDFLEDLWVGATLHDIGKVGIPDAIFLKPGKLTPDEYDIMKQHTVLGHQILDGAPISQIAKMCVLHHHERWDGQGYPKGLKGEGIPRAARIVTVVDIFDALTSDRPYRPAMTEEEAVDLIRVESGGALQPELVECFLALHTNSVIRGASHPIPQSARRRWNRRHELPARN